jgi:hypothetical protein
MDYRESLHSATTDGNSPVSNQMRNMCSTMLKTQIPDHPDLWEKLIPNYPPGCKRIISSDDYYPAIADPKTTLETNRITRITNTGVEVDDGQGGTKVHEHDLLILATGFRAVEFLYPIQITGTHNRSLAKIWTGSGGASALYGTTVPSLPNFGMFYGPNTNLGHNSIVLMIEAQSRYLSSLVSAVLDARSRGSRLGLMPKKQRTDDFNDKIQEILQKSSFADPSCQSWYKNEEGKITNNWSGTVVEYQEVLSKVDWEDFEVVGNLGENVSASKVVFGDGRKESRIGRVREETYVGNTGLVMGMVSVAALGTAWAFRKKW